VRTRSLVLGRIKCPPSVGDGKWQVFTNGGLEPRWPRQGKEIFYVRPDNMLMLMAVEVEIDASFEAVVPRAVSNASEWSTAL